MSRYNYQNEAEDKWFRWQGKRPPERNPHLTEEELEQALNDNLKDHVCDWEQEGNYIHCAAGKIEHGKNIGVFQRLAGTKPNGEPILVGIGPIYRKDVVN